MHLRQCFLFFGISMVLLVFAEAEPSRAEQILLSAEDRSYLNQKEILKVCIDPDWMPNEKITDGGEYLGISSDYMALFSEQLGIPIVLHPTATWQETMEAARARDCDLISLINQSPEREAFLNFSTPYLSYAYVLVAQAGVPYIDDIALYPEDRFSVVAGYRVGEKIRETYPGISLVEVSSTLEGQEMVLKGEVLAHIDTSVVQTYVTRIYGLEGLRTAGTLPWRSAMSLATRNDEPLLAPLFQRAIDAIPPNEHARIRNKWIAVTVQKVFDTALFLKISAVILVVTLLVSLWVFTLWRSRRALRKAHHELEKMATTDSLTQLLNRHAITQKLDEEIVRSKRYPSEFGVILLDIDHFKRVNDGYGHQVGDTLLQEFSCLLASHSRTTDLVGRWGGEEFIILCPGTGMAGLRELGEKLCETIANHPFSTVGKCSASFGLSVFKPSDTDSSLLERADRALYQAKENGRNQVQAA